MRLNAQTDYSLRIMMYLAAKDGETATIREIASKLGLSHAHMMRIAAKLAGKGLVSAMRGRSGGLTLARLPQQITVEEVITAIEPDFALTECFQTEPRNTCSIEPACLLRGALADALGAFFRELRAVSLADLTERNRLDLADIFRLDEPIRKETLLAPRKGGRR